MKKLLKTSLLAIMLASAIACSKDDKDDVTNNPTTNNNGNNGNNNPTPAQMIVGDWEMNGFDQDGDATSGGTTVYTYTMVGSNFSGLFSFKSDNTYENSTEYDIDMTMTIPGFGNQTVNQTVNTSDSGTWTINTDGDLVIISDSNTNAPQVLEIATISNNKLILKGSISQQQTQGGITATVTGNSTLSFEK